MEWLLYDNGLRHERVKKHLHITLHITRRKGLLARKPPLAFRDRERIYGTSCFIFAYILVSAIFIELLLGLLIMPGSYRSDFVT